ncbi:MAG: Protein translocase subunit SecY [Candidatus Moanabacter tarae]|uniref:Protein translocase subunit SecY n=1 Tax=Candidatus Moanibacter tarae TaxID=2200854 RepID=A0A2Z4ABK6_9BACT|nr:MAG: Protein translocase subunit SecY [Candidatus Moanabacter tarae]|tara:strand:+ start:14079 stop:15575 length:1497 start_codon:yes stop_codon:yes gene_type:complete
MISAFVNCIKIPELKRRIGYTLFFLFIARIGANIPLPGLDPAPLQNFFADQSGESGSLVGLYNMFTGGALLKGAVCALGIMPYISASIIFQLMTAVVPMLARLQQEGEVGRQKITQYTRYATVGICLIQAFLLIMALRNPGRLFSGFSISEYGPIVLVDHGWFLMTSVVFLTAGTVLLMWLGEQITQNGIGQGISLLITVGILADLPSAAAITYRMFNPSSVGMETLGAPHAIMMLLLLSISVAGIIALTQAQRKIPVQYAKRVVGRKVYGGQSSFLPLKVNYSGVMPVIFASAILLFFQSISQYLGAAADLPFVRDFAGYFQQGGMTYYLIFGILILCFSYFWVSVMFKPIQIADDLKKNGGYIPGVRPGEPTAKFLDFVMTRLTLFGALALTVIAVFPDWLNFTAKIPYPVGQFFGGTGMLIIIGVLLDTLRQIETFLLQRHYDGFLRKGRIRGRSATRSPQIAGVGELKGLNWFWLWLGIAFFIGLASSIIQKYI